MPPMLVAGRGRTVQRASLRSRFDSRIARWHGATRRGRAPQPLDPRCEVRVAGYSGGLVSDGIGGASVARMVGVRSWGTSRFGRRLRLAVMGSWVVLLLSLACAEQAAQVRRHTYPPDFQYITNEQLQVTMWQLAALIGSVEAMVDSEEGPEPHRFELLRVLGKLETTAAQLKAEGVHTGHPLLSAHLDTFRDDVIAARREIAREPPGFVRVGTLSGACRYCHSR